jgi:uncharacterized protein YigA (DUF484 family)
MIEDSEANRTEAYLRANPSFLAERPSLYRALVPPQRIYGEGLADHMAAMIRAERRHAADMEGAAATVLNAGRAATAIVDRVHDAVLALLAAPDPVECVQDQLPGLLGVDAASLCCEGVRKNWRTLPPGSMRLLMRGRTTLFRDRPADAVLMHAEAALLAERDVLIALPGSRPALLALVSRDPETLPALYGTQAFTFLGRVLASLLKI